MILRFILFWKNTDIWFFEYLKKLTNIYEYLRILMNISSTLFNTNKSYQNYISLFSKISLQNLKQKMEISETICSIKI